ncbi:MAG TPA: dTDP-glucose 4,6-dehydratase [Turneriella sp.]|nr:dTDP-glucose 4,6-dehydratase [Turneriella sp.]HMY10182.1 dTDP-glucose 4,6-dehydratase [Turneriella sp.]HNE19915.1 dTDP-glucose 4,6-dehydratase [Turneriella sp.]HNL10010.1 dTDP-glucose 4,6-dehydratase [Turneriella sp.]HNM99579.1 dTDP-glucose 4,6-dehydratase [Turneriella sp.]
MKTIIVTGGAGFIGSNFILHMLERYQDYKILNLDKLTYAANKEYLESVASDPRYELVVGDILDRELVMRLFSQHDVAGVVHFAAESHVDNSISGPAVFIETNIKGTLTLLEAARAHWMDAPFRPKAGKEHCRFLHVSTDEVYGSLGETGLFREDTPYAPNSPYSASKAGSDFLARAWHHTYGMNTVITNCSNNYGPHQHAEKLIPTIIRKALAGEKIPIYGDGKNVRDWLYVRDHCSGIDLAFHQGKAGETYNIGGRNERNNLQIVGTITELLQQLAPPPSRQLSIAHYKDLITFVADRPGHDRRYAIDATKIETQLGWKAQENFESGIRKTVEWYLAKGR